MAGPFGNGALGGGDAIGIGEVGGARGLGGGAGIGDGRDPRALFGEVGLLESAGLAVPAARLDRLGDEQPEQEQRNGDADHPLEVEKAGDHAGFSGAQSASI
jgi:hypothetical protein